MTQQPASPPVTGLSWGQIEIDGQTRYRDAKLYPGGSREWDWNETGTKHSPGILPADVEELLEHGAEVVVLSRGQQQRLQVASATKELLAERSVDYDVLPTQQAIDRYNELAKRGRAVGGLFHTTC
jgi:hypothetical protein